MERPLLNELKEKIEKCKGEVIVGVLPTGYGKTSFVRHYLAEKVKDGYRVVHVLPLRAIVRQTAEEASKKLGDYVGYQAGVIAHAVKSPYLVKNYMIVTIDSYSLSFYGIPVYEILRSHWHSDVAYALARSFDILILDEYHLMVTGDGEGDEEKDLLGKQASVIRDIIDEFIKLGRCVLILTATLPPPLLKAALPQGAKVTLIGYGDERWIKYWRDYINFNGRFTSDPEFEGERCGCLETRVISTTIIDGVVEINNAIKILKDKGVQSAFFAFNSWRRALKTFEKYKERVESEVGCKALYISGKMSEEQRSKVLKNITKGNVCLFATQVVEAGVDVSFDALVTEAAPLPSLIQRAGRVARHSRPSDRNVVIVLRTEDIEKMVKGIYDKNLTEESLRLIESSIRGNNKLDWRCKGGNCESVWVLLYRLSSKYQVNANAPSLALELDALASAIRPPREVLERIDEKFNGSFVRNSALISLIPSEVIDGKQRVGLQELDEIVKYAIPADVTFLRNYKDYLVTEVEGEKERCFAVIAQKVKGRDSFEIRLEKVNYNNITERPLSTTWRLAKGEFKVFLGLLLRRGAFDEEKGLRVI